MLGPTSLRRPLGRGLVAAFAILALDALAPSRAEAYCRTSACGTKTGTLCTPARADDCGVGTFWPTPCTSFTIQKDGSKKNGIDAKTTEKLVKQAFDAWMQADCGNGAHPKIRVDDLGFVTCDQPEYNRELANSNTIMYRDDAWPYPQSNTIALTTVTFNLDTGEIRDADMELNTADVHFTTGDTNVTFDLLSILTHETGHFLGLAHSQVVGATMEANYPPMSLDLRSLDPDDVAGICAVYPAGTVPDTCDSTPKNGLGDACKSPKVDNTGCCAVAPTGAEGGAPAALTTAIVGLGIALSRRRARRRT